MLSQTVVTDEKLRTKLLRKLEGLMKNPKVEMFDHGTGKRAYFKKAFQVLGQLYSIELVFLHKLQIEGPEVFIRQEHYLKMFNSRSGEGGYNFYTLNDIAKALGLTVTDMQEIFNKLNELSKFKEKELDKAKAFMLRRISKSAEKVAAA
jgi:hypothetical protein